MKLSSQPFFCLRSAAFSSLLRQIQILGRVDSLEITTIVYINLFGTDYTLKNTNKTNTQITLMSINRRMNEKIVYSHIMEYYTAIKINAIALQVTKWINLKNTMLNRKK